MRTKKNNGWAFGATNGRDNERKKPGLLQEESNNFQVASKMTQGSQKGAALISKKHKGLNDKKTWRSPKPEGKGIVIHKNEKN